jgi:hypothetical protein
LPIQVVHSQRDNNSIEIATGLTLHLLAVLSWPSTNARQFSAQRAT